MSTSHGAQRFVPALSLVLLAACTQPVTGGSSKSGSASPSGGSTGASLGSSTDAESNPANPPQQVAGSYLLDCANVGAQGYGCAVTEATTKKKTTQPINGLVVTAGLSNNTSVSPTPSQAPAGDPYSFYFPLLATNVGLLTGFKIGATVAGAAVAQAVPATAIANQPIPVNPMVATANVLFVTRRTYTPGQIGFDSADTATADCLALGQASKFIPHAANLKWAALLSIESADATPEPAGIKGYVGTLTGPIINTAGQVIASSSAGFWGPHLAPMDTDENGDYVGDQAVVWTGSDATGNNIDGQTCSSWSDATAVGAVGVASDTTHWLNQGAPVSCATPLHLYCLGAQ